MLFQGHLLQKPTWLWSDMDGCKSLARKMNKKTRDLVRKRQERSGKVFYVVDKNKKVHGTKELGETAKWTTPFSVAVFEVWCRQAAAQMIEVHSSDSE